MHEGKPQPCLTAFQSLCVFVEREDGGGDRRWKPLRWHLEEVNHDYTIRLTNRASEQNDSGV